MMEQLKEWDKKLFLLINDGMSNSFFDFIMPWMRDKYFWIPLYIIFIIMMIYYYRKKSWMVIGVTLAVVGVSDFVSSGIFKPFFHRLRPCQNPELASNIHHIIECGSGYSFVSSHAANHFALAVFLGLIFKEKIKWLLPVLILWAAIICFAQIYVGYHYPADIFVGAVIGIISALIGVTVLKKYLLEKK